MNPATPRLSIGLPVFNGERYLSQALDSILAQSFPDFEVIVSDNASTDASVSIVETYMARDGRISLFKNSPNRGAAWNYNFVFSQARGEYFKWAAHDDLLQPTFLEKCVDILDQDPSVVLVHPKTKIIDENSQVIGSYETRMDTTGQLPSQRFHDLVLTRHPCTAAFGVSRRNILQKTPLIASYVGSDRVLLAEMGLYGRLIELPDYLFYRRDHPGASIRRFNPYERQAWFDQKGGQRVSFPTWRIGWEYFRAVNRVPIGLHEKIACYRLLAFWLRWDRKRLTHDLAVASGRLIKTKKEQRVL